VPIRAGQITQRGYYSAEPITAPPQPRRYLNGFMRCLVTATVVLLLFQSPLRAGVSCAVVGDSIAEGLQGSLRECRFNTKIGIGTAALISRVPANAGVIVVSAGSNDYLTPGLPARLQALRARVGSARVIWIRPIPKIAAAAVDAVAQSHGDPVVGFVVSPTDRLRLHPQSSVALATEIRRHF
jgi:hypothetical protein